jgi:hypothetical protein
MNDQQRETTIFRSFTGELAGDLGFPRPKARKQINGFVVTFGYTNERSLGQVLLPSRRRRFG